MDVNILINNFDSLKVSAVKKLKLINNDIKDVTIGPNSSPKKVTESPKHVNNTNGEKTKAKTIEVKIQNDDFPYAKVIIEAEKHRKDQVEVSINILNLNRFYLGVILE